MRQARLGPRVAFFRFREAVCRLIALPASLVSFSFPGVELKPELGGYYGSLAGERWLSHLCNYGDAKLVRISKGSWLWHDTLCGGRVPMGDIEPF